MGFDFFVSSRMDFVVFDGLEQYSKILYQIITRTMTSFLASFLFEAIPFKVVCTPYCMSMRHAILLSRLLI